ncbi:MAG: hypothetical protein ACRD52_10990 [Candidatus Acidiferrales bacterium]
MKKKEDRVRRGHDDLYQLISEMNHIIGTQRHRHPKTRIGKDLLTMVDRLREIQEDWVDEQRERQRNRGLTAGNI